jgi:hypothetical protein
MPGEAAVEASHDDEVAAAAADLADAEREVERRARDEEFARVAAIEAEAKIPLADSPFRNLIFDGNLALVVVAVPLADAMAFALVCRPFRDQVS